MLNKTHNSNRYNEMGTRYKVCIWRQMPIRTKPKHHRWIFVSMNIFYSIKLLESFPPNKRFSSQSRPIFEQHKISSWTIHLALLRRHSLFHCDWLYVSATPFTYVIQLFVYDDIVGIYHYAKASHFPYKKTKGTICIMLYTHEMIYGTRRCFIQVTLGTWK